ncbi:HAD family hydrolase [Leifsonia sp. McL0607]|uniref:HAD family hydrolase n=1 Tax=Leifsonia sp. McL0607 TaxID=3415672 RepID=UPI003CE9D0ED
MTAFEPQQNVVRAVFTDLDGTLVSTRRANFAAYRDALGAAGVEFPWETFLSTWGEDSRDFLPRIAPGLSRAQIDEVRAEKARRYPEHLRATELNEPLVRLLRTWASTVPVALVTTAKRAGVDAVIAHHGLQSLFSFIVCGDDIERSKPAPEAYALAVETVGLQPEQCITFEDSEVGIESAQRAGVAVIRVTWSGDEN